MEQKATDRLHIIEGLLVALDDVAKLSAVVANAADRAAAKAALTDVFGLTEVQVNHVLDMSVSRQTQLGRSELRKEADHLRSLAP